jgi:16S rRNA (cytosine967-C5)-methyltransferase
MAISPARTIAFDVLKRVQTQGAFADEALREKLSPSIRREDARLATDLTFGVLRWQRLLDFLIDRKLSGAKKSLDDEIRIALRMGVYQLWFHARVPARAAIFESVELAKRAKKRSASTLVNAVLRKLATEATDLAADRARIAALLPNDIPPPERLGILYSHPTWLVERWLKHFGEKPTRTLLESDNQVPATSCHIYQPDHLEEAQASLEKAGIRLQAGRLLSDARTLQGGNPSASEALQQGWIVIQDESSQAVAHLLDVAPGNTVLDLCAAPGGKTLLLAQSAAPDGRVIATDLHEPRVRAMKDRFKRAGVGNVECLVIDATQALPFPNKFDRILVDAPCTGTGTLSRHPEIRWRIHDEDLPDLHARQVRLLNNALRYMAPNGRLVYSTCSLEPEENEDVITEAMSNLGDEFRVVTPRGALENHISSLSLLESVISNDGFFRTFPPQRGTDGFFAAAIERVPGN